MKVSVEITPTLNILPDEKNAYLAVNGIRVAKIPYVSYQIMSNECVLILENQKRSVITNTTVNVFTQNCKMTLIEQ